MAVTTRINEWRSNGGVIRFFGEPVPEKVSRMKWVDDPVTYQKVVQWVNHGDPTVHSFPFDARFDVESDYDQMTALLAAMRMS